MTFDLTFEETKQSFDPQFGEVHNVSDGGYERGLAEGRTEGALQAEEKLLGGAW